MKNKKIITLLLSLLVMARWGSLFPCIKLGYKAFSIDGASIPSILMFAGTRFFVCGIVISIIAFIRHKKAKTEKTAFPKGKSIVQILLIGLFTIVLHYALLYIGLTSTDSSKSALIKQLGSLLYVCFAFLFFKSEKFSVWKIIGAVIGFGGIVAINFNPNGLSFSIGDILVVGASVCVVVGSVITKKTVENNSPFFVTGISQFAGGVVLIIASLCMGGSFLAFNIEGLAVFLYICTASSIAYPLWNYILRTSDLSNMFIIKFAEPLFACVFSAMLLGEEILKVQYLIAFILISVGIILGNKQAKPKCLNKEEENNV